MKTIRLTLFVIFVSLMASCTSDEIAPLADDGQGEVLPDEYFNYTLDGEAQTVLTWEAVRTENTFAVSGTTDAGKVVQLQFNQFGNVGDVMTLSDTDFNIPLRTNYHYFKANYFDINIVSLDETNQRIEVTFSGTVYTDEYDLTSESSTISGSFYVAYSNVIPVVAGVETSAKIDGADWVDTDTDLTGGLSDTDLYINMSNDSKYTITIVTNYDTTDVGTFTFGADEASDKVILKVYDTATNQEVEYVSSNGTLTLTTVDDITLTGYTILQGTFSFTATNPDTGETITVTDGAFKTVYQNY